MYENYYFGMHLIWWFLLFVLLFWVYFVPRDIPGQRNRKESELSILRKRFAAGEISTAEFIQKRKVLHPLKHKRDH